MESSERSAALLDAVLNAAVDAIVLAGEDGMITGVNPAVCEMFQRPEDQLVGQSVNILMPEAQSALHDGFLRHHIETGQERIIGVGRDVEGIRKDGSVFPIHLSVGRTAVGDQFMFVAILHDLTHRMATQAALARSQRLDAIGQMTGGISHDFNNLLTVIIGNLELLQMRELDADVARIVTNALDAAELAAELTSRLSVFARRINLKPVEADLRELCERALAILRSTLGARIRIKTEFPPRVRRVLIDPAQLQSALVNLALNARDAMGDEGELLITVEDVTIDDSYMAQEIDVQFGDYVRLSVSDDGAGMDAEVQKRAFEPFFTTKSGSSGTGLGLAMVYGFVRQSGGHVTLYSEPGLGASFGLYFPALAETYEDSQTRPEGRETSRPADIAQGRVVLVVEDNPKVRSLSVTRLRNLGFEVEEASDGDEAYAMLKDGLQVDVLFSDLVMPGKLNGYELAGKVARDFPRIKVLLTSGYASDVVTDGVVRAARHEILHKPFRQAELVRRLQSLWEDGSET
jgi:PAS domain S-box-containing protein